MDQAEPWVRIEQTVHDSTSNDNLDECVAAVKRKEEEEKRKRKVRTWQKKEK